jgi:hypothetical protein
MASKKLTADAQAVFDKFADGTWIKWGDVKAVLDDTPDVNRICRAWNELNAAGLTSGQLSAGGQCKVFSQPLGRISALTTACGGQSCKSPISRKKSRPTFTRG